MSEPIRIYGLTGGIGSGKSEAARRFEHHGIPVVDADRVGHELIAPGGAAEEAVIAAFGDDIRTGDTIDRAKLGAVVFDDPDALQKLNAIVHPRLFAEVARRCQDAAAEGNTAAIVDAALLGERGEKEPWLTGLMLVDCPADIRVERLVTLRGMDRADAEARVAAQEPPESKRQICDWIIDNSGAREALFQQIDEIAGIIMQPG